MFLLSVGPQPLTVKSVFHIYSPYYQLQVFTEVHASMIDGNVTMTDGYITEHAPQSYTMVWYLHFSSEKVSIIPKSHLSLHRIICLHKIVNDIGMLCFKNGMYQTIQLSFQI